MGSVRSRVVAAIFSGLLMVTVAPAAMAEPATPDDAARTACTALAGFGIEGLPDAPSVIASAEPVAATPAVPAHCLVRGWTAGQVGFVVKLPMPNAWTGRFLMVGCGGPCGYDGAEDCNAGMAKGFATAATDSGHTATGENVMLWAYRNPDALADWGHRSTHVGSIAAKAVIEHFYGRAVTYSYFGGCSTGGRQAMIEAQRYPDDFDGIMANSSGHDLAATLSVMWPWQSQAAFDAQGRPLLTSADLTALSATVLAQCDPTDGLVDGLISTPATCHPDLAGLNLAPEKARALERMYAPPVNAAGPIVAEGMLPGSEAYGDWHFLFTTPDMYKRTESLLRYAMYDPAPGPGFSVADWSPEDWPAKFTTFRSLAEATSVDLDAFRAGGGKLLMTHGLADGFVVPVASTAYYDRLTERYGYDALAGFARLFTVPGASHCSGAGHLGPTDTSLDALVAWVEQGRAPERLDVRYPLDDKDPAPPRVRPTFPYPFVATYTGAGSIDDPANFRPERSG